MTDRAKTHAEKTFKTALRKLGWHMYRDAEIVARLGFEPE